MNKFISILILTSIGFAACAQNTYNEVTIPQVLQKIQEGKKDMIILDVRSRGEYNDTLSNNKHLNIGHIKGAINIPIQELQQNPDAIKQIEQYKDKDVYVICSHSYRSRTISNLLLRNGFTKVNNIQGGMSEWFRNYDELAPYRNTHYIRNIGYKNISPSELYSKIKSKEDIVFIGMMNNPRFFFDTLMITFYKYFPEFKNANYFRPADSLQILEKARNANGKTIVLYNMVGAGAAELSDWLAKKGITNVNYLYGNATWFVEYLMNYQPNVQLQSVMNTKSNIKFVTPMSLCNGSMKNIKIIDLRHDTLFSKNTNGTKLTYKTIKNAVNFPYYKTAADFESQFPDKEVTYVLSPHQGYMGIELAAELAIKGYKIALIPGGNERVEWYTNNVPDFKCRNWLVQ